MDELAFTGLDYTDLLLMDGAERRKVLEDACRFVNDELQRRKRR